MSLTLVLPGSIMVSQQEAENKPELTMADKFSVYNEKTKKFDIVPFRIRKCIPVKQVMKMSQDAYVAMLEESTDPKYNKIVGKSKGKPIRLWDTMSEDDRIQLHCALIAKDMNAISFDFNVFED